MIKFAQLKINDYFCNRLRKVRAFSSAGLEHLPYKQRVGGSNPSTPTTLGSFQSGQMGQTVNLLLLASVVRIHHYPQKSCNLNGYNSFVFIHSTNNIDKSTKGELNKINHMTIIFTILTLHIVLPTSLY